MVFGSHELPEHELSEEHLAGVLRSIKRDARDRRIAMVAPLVLAAAVMVAFVAAPPRHGGLVLVPEAEASDEVVLPRVFGANGVWRLAEPIGNPQPSIPGPPWMVDVPDVPDSPDFVLVAPDEGPTDAPSTPSLPVSASSPPTPTLGQPSSSSDDAVDWSAFQAEVRLTPDEASEPAVDTADAATPAPEATGVEDADAAVEPSEEPQMSPDASVPAEASTTPANSSPDEDVPTTEDPVAGPTDADDTVVAVGSPAEANPSTPQPDSPETEAPVVVDELATIAFESVLVHRAHVSVTVLVVDDDSSVIDWCNTRIDWGDGSVTGLTDPGGEASCTAPCEREASPSAAGIRQSLTFTHEYQVVIDAAPRVFVATGDGCDYQLAELHLNTFTVVPY